MVGLADLGDPFQPWWFCHSVILSKLQQVRHASFQAALSSSTSSCKGKVWGLPEPAYLFWLNPDIFLHIGKGDCDVQDSFI